LSGSRDSPMWKRGNFSRSRITAFRPARASTVAAEDPAGPPPITATSYISAPSPTERAERGPVQLAPRIARQPRHHPDLARDVPRSQLPAAEFEELLFRVRAGFNIGHDPVSAGGVVHRHGRRVVHAGQA